MKFSLVDLIWPKGKKKENEPMLSITETETKNTEQFRTFSSFPEEAQKQIHKSIKANASPTKTLRELSSFTGYPIDPRYVRHFCISNKLQYKAVKEKKQIYPVATISDNTKQLSKQDSGNGTSILVIPDAHVKPEVGNERFTWLGKYIKTVQPTIVVCLGDFADMPALSHWDYGTKSAEGRTVEDDFDAVWDAQEKLFHAMDGYKPKRMVMTLGNHEDRINKTVNRDRKYEGIISTDKLGYQDFGWEVHPFKDLVEVEGVYFSHFLPNGLMDKPISGDNPANAMIKRWHGSAITGHRHDLKFATEVRADGTRMTAVVAGCYFQHHEEYVSTTTQKNWWRGLTRLYNVSQGEFDIEFTRIEQIERAYGGSNITLEQTLSVAG